MINFDDSIEQVIEDLNRQIKSALKFDMNGGIIIENNKNIDLAIRSQLELAAALKESGYYTLAAKAVAENKRYIKKRLFQFEIDEFGMTTKQTLDGLLRLDYGKMQSVSDKLIPNIKQKIFDSVITGKSYSQLQLDIDKSLEGFKNEALTQLRTIRREFRQNVEDSIAEQIGFGEEKDDIWEYAGAPLQSNSHAECIWALTQKKGAPYFTDEEKKLFQSGGLYPHTEPRWNCQHNFYITNKKYKDVF
jgi:hypothetical protein